MVGDWLCQGDPSLSLYIIYIQHPLFYTCSSGCMENLYLTVCICKQTIVHTFLIRYLHLHTKYNKLKMSPP